MKVIKKIKKQAHDTHARILSSDVQITQHTQTNDLDQIIALRDNNPDCVLDMSDLEAYKHPANTDNLSRIFALRPHPDQDTLNQPFDALFVPVTKPTTQA